MVAISPLTLVGSLLFGIVAAVYAKKRGKNPYLWFVIGSLLGVIGVFLLFFMPKPAKRTEAPTVDDIRRAPQDLLWYYLDEERQQRGPFSYEVVQRALQEGKLSSKSYVWNPSLDRWLLLEEALPSER